MVDEHVTKDAVISGRGEWLELVVLQGAPSARWYLREQSQLAIGSARDADLVVEDPFVSQRHGRLVRRDGRWRYVDEGSKNGSYLYREGRMSRLPVGDPGTELAPGDALRLGGTLISVRAADQPADGASHGVTPEITASRPIVELEREAKTQQRTRTIEPLARLDEHTASGEAVLDTAARVMSSAFPRASRVLAVHLDATGTRPLGQASASRHGLVAETLGLGATMIQRLALGDQAVVVRDERSTETTDTRGRTCLCAPLRIGDGTRGLLLVEEHGAATFLGADFDLLADIASRTSLALSAVALRESKAREVDSHNEASMAAHDISNGLAAILGALGFLAETDLSTAQRTAVVDALTAARWLTSINRTLLDLAQLETGHLAPTMRSVCVADEIDQCLALVRRLFEPQNVRLAAEVARELVVWADPDLFRRVVINFLGNAARHAPPGSTVTISAELDGDHVRVSVHDRGPGITPEVMTRLFDRRIQGPRPGMIGIGLVFCRTAVERMGGTVGASSTPTDGTTFWLRLACPSA
ncbi:ATP-binding protein [Myxococcota bacterium]|nr:ATP-binding protein [Myxococcota bacterium]